MEMMVEKISAITFRVANMQRSVRCTSARGWMTPRTDGPGSGTPPGHWNIFAQEVSRRDGHTIDDDVKMFFILGNALMDSSITVWDCKRAADSIRPVSATRFLFGGKPIRAWAGPGMGTQLIDGEEFKSYIATPPFASYISGHSTFSASAAQVLQRFTGSDNFVVYRTSGLIHS